VGAAGTCTRRALRTLKRRRSSTGVAQSVRTTRCIVNKCSGVALAVARSNHLSIDTEGDGRKGSAATLRVQGMSSNRVPVSDRRQAICFWWFRKWDLRGLATNIICSCGARPPELSGAALSKRARSTTPPSLRFRINELRAVFRDYLTRRRSSDRVTGSRLDSACWKHMTACPRTNCDTSPNVPRSLTAIW